MLVIHSSDEMYGSDRIVLQALGVLSQAEQSCELWLPDAFSRGERLSDHAAQLGSVEVRRHELPILRRRDLNTRGLAALALRSVRIARNLRKRQSEAAYVTTSAVLPMVPMLRLSGHRPITVHVQEIWGEVERRLLSPLLALADQVVCISESVRSSLDRRNRARAIVVLNGVPDATPVPNMPDAPLTLLVASRWNEWKGHRTLLAAFAAGPSDARLVILGGPPEVGSAVDVEGEVARHPARSRIQLIGEVPDVSSWVDKAHVVCVPSDRPEPFGLLAIEAFRAGRPVIASDAGGVAEVVEDGATGWLYEPGNACELSRVLRSLTLEEVGRRGTNARRSFSADFNLETFERGIHDALLAPRPTRTCRITGRSIQSAASDQHRPSIDGIDRFRGGPR